MIFESQLVWWLQFDFLKDIDCLVWVSEYVDQAVICLVIFVFAWVAWRYFSWSWKLIFANSKRSFHSLWELNISFMKMRIINCWVIHQFNRLQCFHRPRIWSILVIRIFELKVWRYILFFKYQILDKIIIVNILKNRVIICHVIKELSCYIYKI